MNLEFSNSTNKSYYFLFLVLSIYFLDFITGNRLSDIFVLNTLEVSSYNNLWSILTYPLKFTSSASLVLFVFVMGLISKNLETIYKTRVIPIIYLLIILSHGVVFSLINVDTESFLSGTDGISYFILVLHLLLNKEYRVNVFTFELNINKLFVGVMIGMWVFSQSLNYFAFNQNHVLNSFFLAGLGTTNALIVYFQLRLIKRFSKKNNIPKIDEANQYNELEHSLATISESNKKLNQTKPAYEETNLFSNNPYIDEEIMNNILEKINDSGFSSLSENEQRFLEEYSKRI